MAASAALQLRPAQLDCYPWRRVGCLTSARSARSVRTSVRRHVVAELSSDCCRSDLQWQAAGSEAAEQNGRRHFIRALTAILFSVVTEQALARERKPKNIAEEAYETAEDGLKYYDFVTGKGEVAESGSSVSVHFDCIYRTLTVISSRESKLLGGNRVIAQPYNFVVGSKPGLERKRDGTESANGLFSAQAAPKPPKALYVLTKGMRVGGKRTVIVTPEEGYGDKGFAEIPPGATFEMNIELLEVKKEAAT